MKLNFLVSSQSHERNAFSYSEWVMRQKNMKSFAHILQFDSAKIGCPFHLLDGGRNALNILTGG
jgi:hypothetical protein